MAMSAVDFIETPRIDWDTSQPHPFHGPVEELPRNADGAIPRYYYLSPEEIVRIGLAPPRPEPERRRVDAGLGVDKQARFIEALAATGTVSGACAAAGITRMAAYRERNRPDADAFREAWDMAVRATVRILVDSALERAIEGVEEPIFHKGEPVGTRRRHNERLTTFLLRTLDPHRFGLPHDRARPEAMLARGPASARALDAALDRIEDEDGHAAGRSTMLTRVTSVTDKPLRAPVADRPCPR